VTSSSPSPSPLPLPAAAKPLVHKGLAGGLLLALAGAIAFSGKAIIVKLAYRHGVDAVTLIMLRMLFALPLFARWPGGPAAASRR
jgi:NAD(P)H-hydrate repair Nnr-like enzyme with NAD(P)H-hydrate dehydratase domain